MNAVNAAATRRPAVDYIGMDVHKQETQVCIEDAEGAVVLEQRIRTTRERFTALLGGRPRARILLEAATESEWVAQHLESLGHEVIVADPNYAAMYATRSRRVKTDRRDARTLADACRLGAYHPAHRASAAQRVVRAELAVREALVRTRTRYLAVIRAVLRREGIRVPSGSAAAFPRRLERVGVPPTPAAVIAPLVDMLAPLNAAIAAVDAGTARRLAADPVARRLATTPGVGPVTAVAFVATLDDVGRFARPGQVAAYLGLVPGEYSSGERQRRGAITKAGNTRLRWLLVQAAWGIWRDRHAASRPLRTWAQRLAGRRGKGIAAVALARRLAGILFVLWRDGTTFDPARVSGRHTTVSVVA
jgi:transposase